MKHTRNTFQKEVILEELRCSQSHPTAEDLYFSLKKKIPRLSLATVYRNLEILAENGVIIRISSADSVRRYDGNILPHRHLRCTECGKIFDICLKDTEKISYNDIIFENGSVTGIEITYLGICDQCKKQKQTGGNGWEN